MNKSECFINILNPIDVDQVIEKLTSVKGCYFTNLFFKKFKIRIQNCILCWFRRKYNNEHNF
jgi:hypothetical protein